MWSNQYYYLNIYHDEKLRSDFDTRILQEFLKSIMELQQVNDFSFKNISLFPFVKILLLNARSIDSWSENDSNAKITNLIVVVCSKDNIENFEEIKRVLIKIASFVNWQLVDEETEEAIENHIVWKPENKLN